MRLGVVLTIENMTLEVKESLFSSEGHKKDSKEAEDFVL